MKRKLPHAIAWCTAVGTVILLLAGALVTSTGSGLAVPDWPLSFGTLFPDMAGGVFYEHGHRLIAGGIALLTVLQMIIFLKLEPRRWVKKLSVAALVLVIVQALMGGLTVLLRLPPQTSIIHACLAQLFFCTQVSLVLFTSRSWERNQLAVEDSNRHPYLPAAAICLTALFFGQLVLGAVVRHTGAGLAIPDFPLMFGGLIPTDFGDGVLVHFMHRMGGYLIVLYSSVLVWWIFSRFPAQFELILWAGGLLALLSIQIMLGAGIIWLQRPVAVTSVHLVVGALSFACSTVISLKICRWVWAPRLPVATDFSRTKRQVPQWRPA